MTEEATTMNIVKPGPKKEKKEEGLWEMLRTVFYALLLALIVRSVAYEPFSIPSESMLPSLYVNDFLFVSKYTYGYSNHSFPFSPNIFDERVWVTPPSRGDVAVFKLPRDGKTDYIKRIIGLPGDEVQMRGGFLFINGKQVQRRKVQDFVHGGQRYTQYDETLPEGRKIRVVEMGDVSPADNTPVYRVPEGHYFMMGDNRDNSRDSRYLTEVGYVPLENFVGKASFLFFSVDGTFWKVWEWPWTIRWERVLKAINE